MIKAFATIAAFTLLFAACGGGDDDGGDGGSGGGGTSAMAAGFSTELSKIKECVQGEIDGKGACGINFLQDPVTRFCSDVRTGKTNALYPQADLTKFTATCDDWKNFLTLDAATKITTLDKMIADVGTLQ